MDVSDATIDTGVYGQKTMEFFSIHFTTDSGKPGTLCILWLYYSEPLLLDSRIVDFESCRPTNLADCISKSGCFSLLKILWSMLSVMQLYHVLMDTRY